MTTPADLDAWAARVAEGWELGPQYPKQLVLRGIFHGLMLAGAATMVDGGGALMAEQIAALKALENAQSL